MDAELPVQLEEVREAENAPFLRCSSTLALVGVGLFFSTGRSVISPDLSLQVRSSTRSLSQDGREITFQF